MGEENQIQIQLSKKTAQGTYSNMSVISHSQSDFVLDFIRIVPGVQQAKVKSRIILTPENAKRLLIALNDNIQKFENTNGTISIREEKSEFLPPIGEFGQA